MRGGAGHSKFLFDQVGVIADAYRTRLTPTEYTEKELSAGLDKLGKEFGSFATIKILESETPFNRYQIVKMSVSEIHMELIYLNRRNAANKRYSDLK